MKISLACWALLALVSADTGETNRENLLERASAQLERLSAYRRSGDVATREVPRDTTKDESKDVYERQVAMQILEALPDNLWRALRDANKVDGDDKIRIDILDDSEYSEVMRERIKRSGSFVSNIAGGVINSVVRASSGASRGSSSSSSEGHQHSYPSYGHQYGEKPFDIWDFKRAILSTLIQAVKAIGGGVLALKGQLLKGGGFLVSTKGRIISSTGEVVSSLGRQIASSAVVNPPKHQYGYEGYSYDHPPALPHPTGHDSYGAGPPAEEYGTPNDGYNAHNSYAAPSDDDDHSGGLLVAKPAAEVEHDTKPDHQSSFTLNVQEGYKDEKPKDEPSYDKPLSDGQYNAYHHEQPLADQNQLGHVDFGGYGQKDEIAYQKPGFDSSYLNTNDFNSNHQQSNGYLPNHDHYQHQHQHQQQQVDNHLPLYPPLQDSPGSAFEFQKQNLIQLPILNVDTSYVPKPDYPLQTNVQASAHGLGLTVGGPLPVGQWPPNPLPSHYPGFANYANRRVRRKSLRRSSIGREFYVNPYYKFPRRP